MSRLAFITPEKPGASELAQAQQRLYESILGGKRASGPKGGRLTNPEGGLVGPFNALLHSPEIGTRIHEFGEAIRFSSSLPQNLLEIAVLVIGREWSAQFEWWAHERFARRDGVGEEVIRAIKERRDPPAGDPAERAVHRFCRELIDTRRVSDATYKATVELLGEAGVVELVALLGYYSVVSMLLNVFAVELPPGQTPPFEEPPHTTRRAD